MYAGVPALHFFAAQYFPESAARPKIRDAHAAAPVEHNIFGFQIAMQHTVIVRRRKSRAHLPCDIESPWPAEIVRMRRSSEARSSPSTYSMVRKSRPRPFSPTSKTRHTFASRNFPRQPHFLVKTIARVLIRHHRDRQKFQRDRLVPASNQLGAVHLAHPAFASSSETMR